MISSERSERDRKCNTSHIKPTCHLFKYFEIKCQLGRITLALGIYYDLLVHYRAGWDKIRPGHFCALTAQSNT